MTHIPVLKNEVIYYLEPKPNENFIDCTLGDAGHAKAILEKTAPNGKVLGIDWDKENIARLKKIEKLIAINDSFADLNRIIEKEKFHNVSGILLDLGFSSRHIEESGRGFSFLKNEPLDMRYNLENPKTAEKIVNFWAEADLEKIFREYGEEQFSRQITKEIVRARGKIQIKSTLQLLGIIKRGVPAWYQRGKIHFATKTFQALRIAVNGELDNLEKVLPQAVEVLNPGGKLAVISFHSLEDRIVKIFFKDLAKEGLINIKTKKPVQPQREEIINNPRARSAKLRVAQRI